MGGEAEATQVRHVVADQVEQRRLAARFRTIGDDHDVGHDVASWSAPEALFRRLAGCSGGGRR